MVNSASKKLYAGDYDDAIKLYSECKEYKKQFIMKNIELANDYAKNNKYDKAINKTNTEANTEANTETENGIYTAEADGYGNYELDSVPVGQYYLLIKSNKTRSNMTIDANTASILQGLFSANDWNKLQTTLKLNKYVLKTVEIKSDKTIIESYDFGYTYF